MSSVVTPWADLGFVLGLGEDDQAGVGVHVDEAGTHGQTRGVDGLGRRGPGGVAPQEPQAPLLHGHRGLEPGGPGAVVDSAVADQQVIHGASVEHIGLP